MRALLEADDPEVHLVADVRHWVLSTVRSWPVSPEATDVAELVVSELVTNAVRHARTAFAVALEHTEGVLRIEVFDRDTRLPVAVAVDESATGGRGLALVNALSHRWGSHTAEQDGIRGKVVWAEIAAYPRR